MANKRLLVIRQFERLRDVLELTAQLPNFTVWCEEPSRKAATLLNIIEGKGMKKIQVRDISKEYKGFMYEGVLILV